MTLFVRDLVNAEPPQIEVFKPRNEPAQVLLIDPFRGFPVDRRHRCGVGEGHLRTEHARSHSPRTAWRRGCTCPRSPASQRRDSHIGTVSSAPLSEDEKALLRAEIEISDPLGIGILNGRAPLAAFRTVTGLTRTVQKQRYPMLILAETAKRITAEIKQVSE
jgi:hypothetical protein